MGRSGVIRAAREKKGVRRLQLINSERVVFPYNHPRARVHCDKRVENGMRHTTLFQQNR